MIRAPLKRRARASRAFTIAEMAVSLSVLSILMVAMGSAVTIAARALPTPASPINAELGLDQALDRMGGELRYAKTVESSGTTFVQFTVADRDGDGADEHIRYEWLGAGLPLTRSYNSAAAVPISTALNAFSIGFVNQKITTTQTVNTTTDSGEVLFTSCSGWTGLVPIQTNTSLNAVSWATSYFKPDKVTIPAAANYVAITRVRLKLKKTSSPDGSTITVGIYTPSSPGGPVPSTTQVGSAASLAVSTLTTSYPASFIDFTFSDVTFASAPTELNFVVKGSGLSCGSVMYYNNTLAPVNNPVYLWTTNSGGVWSPSSSRQANDGVFEVYGSYRTPATSSVNIDTYYLHTFTLAADSAASPSVHAQTTMRALNQPTVVGP